MKYGVLNTLSLNLSLNYFFRLLTHVQGGFYFSGIGKFRGVVKGTYEETENQFQCFFQGNKVRGEMVVQNAL